MSGTPFKATALLAGLQLILGGLAAVPARLVAQRASVESLVPAKPVGYVNDFASLIDPATARELEDLIQRLRGATGAELAVVTLSSIADHDAADVALAIGRKWEVGREAEIGDPRRNAGLVLLVVPRRNHQPGTGHVRIETGQGLEGIVTDATAGQIRRDVMGPPLEREAYGEALKEGVQALVGVIARGYGVSDSTLTAYQPPVDSRGGTPTIGNLLPIILLVLFLLMASGARGGRRRRRSGIYWGGPWIGGGWGGGRGFGGGGGGFGGFGGGGGFSGGGAGGRF